MYYSNFTNQEYSRNSFVDLVGRRLRKYLRGKLDIKKKYCILNEDVLGAKVLQVLLKEMYGGRLDVNFDKTNDRILMSPDHLEKYISLRWNVFLKGNNIEPFEKNMLFPLRVVTANECLELGKIYDLKGVAPEKAENFIEDLQKKYPQTKASMLSSFDFLSDFRKNKPSINKE